MALSARKPSCKLVHGWSAMDRSTEFLIATVDTLELTIARANLTRIAQRNVKCAVVQSS